MAFMSVGNALYANSLLMLSIRSLPMGLLMGERGWPLNQMINLVGLGVERSYV